MQSCTAWHPSVTSVVLWTTVQLCPDCTDWPGFADVVLGIEDARTQRARHRNESQLYLRRPQLMPFPRVESAWQHLYESQDDHAFIMTMGVDVETFHTILDSGFQDHWDSTPIPRPDVASRVQPRLGAHSLEASGALGLILHYLNSAMLEVSLQQIFALIPSTIS